MYLLNLFLLLVIIMVIKDGYFGDCYVFIEIECIINCVLFIGEKVVFFFNLWIF